MEDLDPRVWDDVLLDLLRGSDDAASAEDASLLAGFVDGAVDLGDDVTGAAWPVEGVRWDQIELPDLSADFLVQDAVSLPGLGSETSSLPEAGSPVATDSKDGDGKDGDGKDGIAGVSSPGGSCSGVDVDCGSSQNMAEARASRPTAENCAGQKRASPDTGDSADVGAMGRSCDNFADVVDQKADAGQKDVDDDAKRQSRLMRNRESATQSRLRKKSYMKDLEIKCRAMESKLSMLERIVAATSEQNAALTAELTRVKSLKGSKVGGMEPAALPSDSLPSESPSRHTGTCHTVKLDLIVLLFHVLLLGLLQVVPQSPAASGGSNPSQARIAKHDTNLMSSFTTRRFSRVSRKKGSRSSSRRKGRAQRKEGAFCASHRKSFVQLGSLVSCSSSLENSIRARSSRGSRFRKSNVEDVR